MANFELRIYVIDQYTYEDVKAETDPTATGELDDETFIELCEEQGGVYSLNGFLSKETHDTIDLTENVFRAYFVEVDNGNSAPIRADHYFTVINASKISYDFGSEDEQVLYLELNKPFGKSTVEEEPISRTYTVVLTNHDEENDLTGVIADIQDKDYVQDVELLEEYENKVRIQVEVDSDIDFDKLCTDLEDWLGVTADLINEVENY